MENDKKLIDLTGEYPESDLFFQACNDICLFPDSVLDKLESIFWENPQTLHDIKTLWWEFAHNAMPIEIYERLFSCIYIGWRIRELYEKENL